MVSLAELPLSRRMFSTRDSFPTSRDGHEEKASVNAELVTLSAGVSCKRCLVLDGAGLQSTKALLACPRQQRRKDDMVVPNACSETFLAIQRQGVCRCVFGSLRSYIDEYGDTGETFGLIYCDYCCSLFSGKHEVEKSPVEDLKSLLRSALIVEQASDEGTEPEDWSGSKAAAAVTVLAVTLAKPDADAHNNEQLGSQPQLLAQLLAELAEETCTEEQEQEHEQGQEQEQEEEQEQEQEQGRAGRKTAGLPDAGVGVAATAAAAVTATTAATAAPARSMPDGHWHLFMSASAVSQSELVRYFRTQLAIEDGGESTARVSGRTNNARRADAVAMLRS
eukprot:g867.t1